MNEYDLIIDPCPMCGRYDGDMQEKLERREWERDRINLVLTGIKLCGDNGLSARQMDVFMARFYLGMESYEHIANNLGISKATVQTHLDRAMDKVTEIVKLMSYEND